MERYALAVSALNFAVDWLLLLGANRLCFGGLRPIRFVLAAAFGGLYAGLCLFDGFSFLAAGLWPLVRIGVVSVIAFGIGSGRQTAVFFLLVMALNGICSVLSFGGPWGSLLAGACLLLCARFLSRFGSGRYVPVELNYGNTKLRITALHDTGNLLQDPITGRSVLVVGSDVAHKLIGLSSRQLKSPVEAVGVLPGLRLVPYKSVGQPNGFLLAMVLKDVKIAGSRGSRLVAFAPEPLSLDGKYHALTGGVS